ncbi:toxin-antitoxin system YwqK family antitoxin [Flavobacterium sp. W20_MBD1_R3]|uniref:toxin-antitoxin system YwqK family antitoxin n=1 Tax=Flavobacterium sp. W20_MBD1_R3 TaxID=3240278 RepID=UPI003F8F4125
MHIISFMVLTKYKVVMKKYEISFFVFLIFMLFSQNCLSQTESNKVDEKGKKHGVWKGLYEASKRPRYEGTFEHGKEIGIFYFYDDTKAKSLLATREFNSKDNVAYTIFYDQKGNRVSEGKVINKLFEGQWKYYHQASKLIMTTENYGKGKLEGLRTVFYLNGKIAEEINYKNNLKSGFYKKYTENGILLEESAFKDGDYVGIAIFRDSKGNIVSKGQFVNGKKAGIWQFFENGKITKEVNMSFPENATKSDNN